MVSIESLVISIPCVWFSLHLQLLLCLVYDHATLFMVLYYWFSSCLLLCITFIDFRVLGISWERGNLMELRESLMKPSR